ncbi:hypothetical protein D3C72_2309120 [compost metagenome]
MSAPMRWDSRLAILSTFAMIEVRSPMASASMDRLTAMPAIGRLRESSTVAPKQTMPSATCSSSQLKPSRRTSRSSSSRSSMVRTLRLVLASGMP